MKGGLSAFPVQFVCAYTYVFSRLLANLMLPDGAEKQLEDWTIFFLNQTPFNTIAPVLALESTGESPTGETGNPELLYVLNLVRTKHDKTVRRCVVSTRLAYFADRVCLITQRCRGQSDGDLYTAPIHRHIQGEQRPPSPSSNRATIVYSPSFSSP